MYIIHILWNNMINKYILTYLYAVKWELLLIFYDAIKDYYFFLIYESFLEEGFCGLTTINKSRFPFTLFMSYAIKDIISLRF